jgi:hypothetical protein
MKGKIVGSLAALGLAAQVGILMAATAQPAPAQVTTVAPAASAAAVAASGARGLCIQNNTGLPFYLPLVDGKCPAASGNNPGYWLSDPPFGITTQVGPQGPAGPQGATGPWAGGAARSAGTCG